MAPALAALALFALTCAVGAEARSLKVRERLAAQEKALLKDVAITNKTCESKLTVRFNWAAVPEADLDKFSPEGYGDNGLLLGIRQV